MYIAHLRHTLGCVPLIPSGYLRVCTSHTVRVPQGVYASHGPQGCIRLPWSSGWYPRCWCTSGCGIPAVGVPPGMRECGQLCAKRLSVFGRIGELCAEGSFPFCPFLTVLSRMFFPFLPVFGHLRLYSRLRMDPFLLARVSEDYSHRCARTCPFHHFFEQKVWV